MKDGEATATMFPGEQDRIDAALRILALDPHAPNEITVKFRLHVYHEYPKHVTVGEDANSQPIIKVVNSADEEAAVLAGLAPQPPQGQAEPVQAEPAAEMPAPEALTA